MKILITGATGLVGTEIVRQCRQRGYSVNFLTTSRQKIPNEDGLQGFFWNPAAGVLDPTCFEGVTAVINLAGSTIAQRWTSQNKARIQQSRISSIQTLFRGIDQLKQHQIQYFVSASAIGVYPSSLDGFYEESCEEVDDSFLGETVAAWEAEAYKLRTLKVPVGLVRVGLVLDTEQGALPRMAAPVKNFVGAALGTGQQWQSWIHREDIAGIFMHLVEHQLEGPYNGVAPNPVTNAKLTRTLAHTLKRPLILPKVPKIALKLLFGEMSYILLASQRVSSRKIQESGYRFKYASLENAMSALYPQH